MYWSNFKWRGYFRQRLLYGILCAYVLYFSNIPSPANYSSQLLCLLVSLLLKKNLQHLTSVCFTPQDIFKDAIESNITSAVQIPYFEGDFWPNVIEESIKELDQEEEEKRKREEAEAAAAEAEAQEAVEETLDPVCMCTYNCIDVCTYWAARCLAIRN